MNSYVYLLVYLLVTTGVVGLVLGLNALLGPRVAASATKLEPFECGAPPIQPRNVRRLSIKYYPIAIFFLLFDLETVFLFVLALGAQPLTGFMLATFLLFVGLLVLLLLYVYKARLLEAVTQ